MESHDQIMRDFERQLTVINQRSCFYSANGVVRRFRKFSGQSRASVRMERNRVDTSVTLAAVYARDAITGEIAERRRAFDQKSKQIKIGDTVYISSSLDYSPDVEYRLGDLAFTRSADNWPQDVRRGVRDSQ